MADLSLRDFIEWLSSKTTRKTNGRVTFSGTQGELWGLTTAQANKYITRGEIDKLKGQQAYGVWLKTSKIKPWYPPSPPTAGDYPVDPETGEPALPTAPTSPAGTAPPPQVQGATSYKVIYGGTVWQGNDGKYYDPPTGFELSEDEVNYRYQEFLQTKVNPLNVPPGPPSMTDEQRERLALEQRKFDEQIRQYEEERRRREYQEQIERERQQAEARNKEWQAQYDIQREASQTAIQKQQNELELIKGRAFPFGDEEGRRMQASRDMSGAFESARQQILGSLSSPSDWIKRWEVQNAPNPYTAQPKSPLEEKQGQLTDTQTRVNMFNQMADEAEKLVTQLSTDQDYGAGTPNEATVLTQARNDAIMYRNAAKSEADKLGAYQTDVTYLQGQPQPAISQPAARGNAPAPAWLPMFAPGQQAGRAITRENVATPSAQQWAGTPWSVQQGLSGYLDWAGYRPMADVLGNMAQMLPNAPGGGARWSSYIGR